ncbi:TonB-dependent receptor [Thiomicrorhabdus cannonii]|uniref:TonB-dependent receptor n=1 Tax=Thiomicrorhabdus cannonii TaxID=2748011 RepID=UPI0015BC8323|nr:TonB-dependent receptor [Thiomicrorhabdus cannonii]
MKPTAMTLAIAAVLTGLNAQADELETITVNADLRQTKEQDLPASADIKNSADLQDQGAIHFDDVLLKTPNVNYSGQSSRARHIQIRGIGERDEYTGAPNASVGFAIDDIDFSGIGMAGNLFDVKQVEVLRGPQNTRYGQSAIAGLINIQTNDPTDYRENMIETTLGQDQLKEFGFMTSGPVSSEKNAAQYRIALFKHDSDGFRTNETLDRTDTNGRDELTVRGKLRLFPNEHTTVDVSLIHADLNNGYDAWSRDNSFTTLSDQPGKDTQLSNAGSVKVEWNGNQNYTLNSKTSMANTDAVYAYDGDWLADSGKTVGTYHNDQQRQTISQDFRFISKNKIFQGTTDWVAGLYLSNLHEANNRTERYNYTLYSDIYNTDAGSRFDHQKIAAYGQLDQAITTKTILRYSLRIERNQQNFDLNTRKTGYDTSYGGGAFDYTLTDHFNPVETLWGGSIHYIHKYNDAHTAFAGLTRGYKTGGFNAALSSTQYVKFDSETLYNYEIGLKSNYKEYGLQTATTFFYMDRHNPQFDGYSYEPGGYEWVFFTENLDVAHNYGVETEINWQANKQWNLHAAIGLLQTRIEGTPVNSAFTINNRDQAHAPNYQINLGGKYRSPNGFYAESNITAIDEFYFDNVNNFKSKAYHLIDARLGYETKDYDIYLWGKNLTDERYATRGFEFDQYDGDGTQQYIRLGDPRQFGVTARIYF